MNGKKEEYVDYLMLELDEFKKWYTKDLDGFGNNKGMLQMLEGVLTALTIIKFDGLDKKLQDSIKKIEEVVIILKKNAGQPNSTLSSQAVALCYKALSILVNKLK